METLVVSALVDHFDGMFPDYGQLADLSSPLGNRVDWLSPDGVDDLFCGDLSSFNLKGDTKA